MLSLEPIKEMSNSTLEEDVRKWKEFLERPEQQHRLRMDILAELYQEPASERL
jgi:hypothetical protein